MLTHGISSAFCGGVIVHLFIPPTVLGSVRVGIISGHPIKMRTDGINCRESAGTEPVVLELVPMTGAAFSGVTVDRSICASLFPHPLSMDICDSQEKVQML